MKVSKIINSATSAFLRAQSIPDGTVLSQKQIKNVELQLKNTKRIREVLSDYFERKGKSQDKKAVELDMIMYERECFLNWKLEFFDKARIKKREEKLKRNYQILKEQNRINERRMSLSVEDWFKSFDI